MATSSASRRDFLEDDDTLLKVWREVASSVIDTDQNTVVDCAVHH
jgi:hypothetical protein